MNRRTFGFLPLMVMACGEGQQMQNRIIKETQGYLVSGKNQALGSVKTVNINNNILTPAEGLAVELPYGGYTVFVRQRTPVPNAVNPAIFGALARITFGVTGARTTVIVDAFPFAVVPIWGDHVTVELGWDVPFPTGLTVPEPQQVEIAVGPGTQPWQATRTFRANNPHPMATAFRTNVPPYATHVRVFVLANPSEYVAGTVTELEAPLPVPVDVIPGTALQALNRDGGIRLPQVVQSVQTTSAAANLAQLAHMYSIGGLAGRP